MNSRRKTTVAYDGWFVRFGMVPNEDISDAPGVLPGLVLTHILLLDERSEAGVDAVRLLYGEDRSLRKDVVQVLHGYRPDPSESFDVEHGTGIREDDGAVEPQAVCPSQQPFEPSYVAV